MFSTRKRPVGIALFVFVLAMWLVLPATANATSGTMTVTHSTVLTEDHFGNIVIAADSLTLDCANHLVTGTGSGNVIQIDGRSRVTVKNCRITAGDIGLFVTNSTGPNTLLNNFSFSNISSGFTLAAVNGASLIANRATNNGTSGFELRGSSQNTLRGNSSAGNPGNGFSLYEGSNGNLLAMNQTVGDGSGFATNDANQNLFTHNVARNDWTGFNLFAGSGNTLLANRSDGSTSYGFALWWDSTGSTLARNQATGNGWENFAVLTSTGNRLVDNFSQGSMFAGFSLWGGSDYNVVSGNVAIGNAGSGIDVIQSSHNSITHNTFKFNNQGAQDIAAGINLIEGSSWNCILRNAAYGNGRVDAYDDHTGTGNVWKGNHFGTSDT
jgi:parallel beta-helix repeat protein